MAIHLQLSVHMIMLWYRYYYIYKPALNFRFPANNIAVTIIGIVVQLPLLDALLDYRYQVRLKSNNQENGQKPDSWLFLAYIMLITHD